MKQINKSLVGKANDRDPNWCVFCDARDRCDSCDGFDYKNDDCDTCDFGSECTHVG